MLLLFFDCFAILDSRRFLLIVFMRLGIISLDAVRQIEFGFFAWKLDLGRWPIW